MTRQEIQAELVQDAKWIQRMRDRVEALRDSVEYPGNGRSEPVQGASGADRLSDTVCEIVRLEGEIEAVSASMLDYFFSRLEDEPSVRVLELRYLHWRWGIWPNIAGKLGYSERHVRRIHTGAMSVLEEKSDKIAENTCMSG